MNKNKPRVTIQAPAILSYFELNETGRTILKTLATQGSLTPYAISKLSKISLNWIYKTLPTLKSLCYVTEASGPKTRVGLYKKIYSLTFFGFCNALQLLQGKDDIYMASKKWSLFDEVFLENFDEISQVFGNQALEVLKAATLPFAMHIRVTENNERIGTNNELINNFRETFIENLIRAEEDLEKLKKICRVPKIRSFIDKFLNAKYEEAKEDLDFLGLLRSELLK
jgi:hypothetical protein